MKVKSESEDTQSCPTLVTPWTVAHQAPPSMGYSRQEYWSGVPYAKAIQTLNEEQIQMRKAVIQNRMALDLLTAAQGGTCAIIKVECCVHIPDLSGNVSAALDDMTNQVKAMSNENIPFWTLVLGEG